MRTFILFFILLSFSKIQAQDEQFMVLEVGDDFLGYIAGSDDLRMGKLLYSTDTIKSPGYISLMNLKGEVLEVTKPGNYPVDSLSKLPQQSSYLGYFHYIKQLPKQGVNSHIPRDVHDTFKFIFTPKSSNILGLHEFDLAWIDIERNIDQTTPYDIEIQNEFGDVLWEKSTSDTSIYLDLNQKIFRDEVESGNAIFTIARKIFNQEDNHQAQVGLIYNPEENVKVLGKIHEIDSLSNNASDIYKQLLKISYLEKNNYHLLALKTLNKMYREHPDQPVLKDIYLSYLIRNQVVNRKCLRKGFGVDY